jgi:DNA repair exonuclease SbcCD nuclease subunit
MNKDLSVLRTVLRTAAANRVDILVLAGDIFDHNRVPLAVLDEAARMMSDALLQVVILPGNHDCLVPDSVYRRGGIADPENVHVIGVTVDEMISFPNLDIGLWGRPHMDHVDMSPLRDAPIRRHAIQVAIAHGHWLETENDSHRSWLIRNEEIDAVDADYIALGHWDRCLEAGEGPRRAHYSGSPDLARSVNIVRLVAGRPVEVIRAPLAGEPPPK